MRTYIILIIPILMFFSCQKKSEWVLEQTIDLKEVTPIGMAFDGNSFWVSDGDNNKIVSYSKDFILKDTFQNFDRPMHIAIENKKVFIPEYGADIITILDQNGVKTTLDITENLDAPSGIDINNNEIAIADFYNHQVLFKKENEWIKIGKKGKKAGEFHYPTDVQITDELIYVADAYNNRIQTFNKKGEFIATIGSEQKINALTGICITGEQIFATDFENNRILIFNLDGEITQVIEKGLNNPTDVLVINHKMYICNYKAKNIQVYQK